jgi:hypothetical protein
MVHRQETCPAEQHVPIQEAVEPTTRRLAEVEACHAGTAPCAAARIEGAPRLAVDDGVQEAVETRLEQRL